MNERTVLVRLRAEVADYKRRMDEASAATRKVGDQAKATGVTATTATGRMVQSATQHRQAWEQTGRGMVMFGTLTVGALAATAMAATKWETAWTGVLKTVNGTDAELEVLEGGLRDLARTLPSTHDEIAAVAEAAGQLGVRTRDVVGFTKVMIDLGQTTNLSADEAATSIAQLMNVMRTAPGDVGRLGSALVALGNNGASTERQIIFMAQRISSAAAVVGLTEAEVLGLANALASMGIEVEAGGSAVSRVLMDMAKAVSQNGDDLQVWARVAGMSGEEFARRWKAAPAQALTDFVTGLGRMQAAGQDIFTVLDQLGESDIRTSRALLSMAVSGDLLTDSLRMGTEAWEANTALAAEAGQRYDTTAAKVSIARNNLNDVAITIGDNLLPMLASAAEGVSEFAQKIGSMPKPLQQASAGLLGVTGGAALLGGAFLMVMPRVIDMTLNLRQLSKDGSRIPGMMRRIGRGAGYLTAAVVGFTALTAAVEAFATKNPAATVEETTAALLRMQSTTDLDELFSVGVGTDQIESLESAIHRLTSPDLGQRIRNWQGNLVGATTTAGLLGDQFNAVGESLASLVTSGQGDRAKEMFDQLGVAWEADGGSLEELRDLMPAYTDAMAAASNETQLAADNTEGMVEVYNTATGATEMLTEAQAAYRQEIADVAASFVDPLASYDALIQRNKDLAQATADGTESSSDSWEDFYDGFSFSVDEYLADLQRQVDAQTNWETNLLLLAGRVSQGTLDALIAMDVEGAPLVQAFADGTADQIAELETLLPQSFSTATGDIAALLDGPGGEIVRTAAAQLGDDTAAEIARKLADGTATVDQIMWDYKLEIEGISPAIKMDTTMAYTEMRNFVAAYSNRTIYVNIRANTGALTPQQRTAYSAARTRYGATGGPVFGPGTETSDSIPYLLSFNEHVWSAAEVRGAGGHANVAALRAAALHPTQTMRFADGGSPAWSGRSVAAGATPSLRGLSIEGTLDTPWGPSQIRGMVRDELADAGSRTPYRYAGGS